MQTLLSIATALVGVLFAGELGTWTTRLAEKLVALAARLLPEPQRERYKEEFRGELLEFRSGLGRLTFSIRIIFAFLRLRIYLRNREGSKPTDSALSDKESTAFHRARRILWSGSGAILAGLIGVLVNIATDTTSVSGSGIIIAISVPLLLTVTMSAVYLRALKRDNGNTVNGKKSADESRLE